jgi:uncharacterized membrane protein
VRADDAGAPAQGAGERDALIRRAELVISGVLRGGVLLSAGLITIGVIVYYVRYFTGWGVASAHTIPRSVGAALSAALGGHPTGIIALGLLVLLATPVVRVAVSIVAFALERDWTYVAITTVVLLILLLSFLTGRGGG